MPAKEQMSTKKALDPFFLTGEEEFNEFPIKLGSKVINAGGKFEFGVGIVRFYGTTQFAGITNSAQFIIR